MAAILGLCLLWALFTAITYVVAISLEHLPLPHWRREAVYRPSDRFVTVSLAC